jgi:hypothetical protein
MIRNAHELLNRLKQIHAAIRDSVVAECERSSLEQVSRIVAEDAAGDTIFAIDRVSEKILLQHFEELAQEWSCVLVAEGLGATGLKVLPEGTAFEAAEIYVIVDPIDGTRGLMYQKRPAWILTGVAPNRGAATNLTGIELALQTEIPLLKQHLSDSLWAVAGEGAAGERFNRLNGQSEPLRLQPSGEPTIAQGYGGLARFFPGMRGLLATIDDEVVERILGPVQPGRALAFEDQYISTGGQLYELIMGHDRWQADLRPLVEPLLRATGRGLGLCCHPYDLCTELIAREVGVKITGPNGQPVNAPLDVNSDLAWAGYANRQIQLQVEPVLQAVLSEHGLLKLTHENKPANVAS